MQHTLPNIQYTTDKDLSEKNKYCDPFTAEVLPLDGDFEGTEVQTVLGA